MLPVRAINQHAAQSTTPSTPLEIAADDYIRYARAEQGLSSVTLMNYQQRLRYLIKWLVLNGYPNAELSDLSLPVLRRFLYDLVEGGHRPRTVKGKFAAIDAMCRFLVAEQRLSSNPVEGIKLPKLDAARRELVTDEQIAQLFHACDKCRSPSEVALHRAVLSILAYSGLRRAECRDLRIRDLSLTQKCITVRAGKGNHSRTVYIPNIAVAALKEWLVLRGQRTHEWVFCRGERRIHDDGIAGCIKKLKLLAGLEGEAGIQPHSIRHAYATRLDSRGASLLDIGTVLGHRGSNALRTTQIYLHSDERRAKGIADLAVLSLEGQPAPEAQSTPVTARHNSDWRRRVAVRR